MYTEHTVFKIISLLGGRKATVGIAIAIFLQSLMIIFSFVLAIIGKLTTEWIAIFRTESILAGAVIASWFPSNVASTKFGLMSNSKTTTKKINKKKTSRRKNG